ncbi:hypothetical protein PMG11_10828 [Penicillium brasilianum]|uniref:Phosphotransferase enzyme family protein n=1 Tax=Penicillium brasilianum TaxID=104259 RepID=A0A0F7U256_PENBI|nr:hypothetical protein PMG11_10828 [Penicillium brasilianum]
MNDGKSVLARIPNPNAGPSFHTTASEVATMEFARDFLHTPVPRVLGWNATADNPAGSEYILMGNTWDDDVVSFRESLINVERYWHELGIEGVCPYHFTQAELHNHSVDADGWNEVQDFFDSYDGLVQRDGWTSHESFDAAFGFFAELRNRGLEHLKGEERDIFERQTRWAKHKS